MMTVESKAELELHNISCGTVDNVDDNHTQLENIDQLRNLLNQK